MGEIIELVPLAFIGLIVLYLLSLVILKLLFKIKGNNEAEQTVRQNTSKIYIVLLIIFFIISIIINKNITFALILLLLDNIVIDIQVLKIIGDTTQKYYYISALIFHSLAIITLLLS